MECVYPPIGRDTTVYLTGFEFHGCCARTLVNLLKRVILLDNTSSFFAFFPGGGGYSLIWAI